MVIAICGVNQFLQICNFCINSCVIELRSIGEFVLAAVSGRRRDGLPLELVHVRLRTVFCGYCEKALPPLGWSRILEGLPWQADDGA